MKFWGDRLNFQTCLRHKIYSPSEPPAVATEDQGTPLLVRRKHCSLNLHAAFREAQASDALQWTPAGSFMKFFSRKEVLSQEGRGCVCPQWGVKTVVTWQRSWVVCKWKRGEQGDTQALSSTTVRCCWKLPETSRKPLIVRKELTRPQALPRNHWH